MVGSCDSAEGLFLTGWHHLPVLLHSCYRFFGPALLFRLYIARDAYEHIWMIAETLFFLPGPFSLR